MKRYRSPREVLADVERVLAEKPASRALVLQEICEALSRSRHYFWIGIYLVAGERVVLQDYRGPEPPCRSVVLGAGSVGAVAQTGQVKVIHDVAQDPAHRECFPETESAIAVPIKIAGRMLGVMAAESEREYAFGKTDRVLLQEIARRLARHLTAGGRRLMRRAREAAEAETQNVAAEEIRPLPPASEKRPKSTSRGARRAAAGATAQP